MNKIRNMYKRFFETKKKEKIIAIFVFLILISLAFSLTGNKKENQEKIGGPKVTLTSE